MVDTGAAYSIRVAADADREAVLELAVAFYREEGFGTGREELGANLGVLLSMSSARVAVAIGDGARVGFCVTTAKFGLEQGWVAELEDLYVMPGWRRRGIAEALIEDSAGWATERGCGELELVIAPQGHDVAGLREYYLRRGFVDGGRRLLGRTLRPESPGR
ncbi:GNAT family N-acetyltransferase [Nocardia sp. NPDC004068]|uniref:GNAT family N-acetyltransferase n=1 Tax=Nocardia sp. NPDC004068 TaxID=3364303 RepID=UPI00367C13F8